MTPEENLKIYLNAYKEAEDNYATKVVPYLDTKNYPPPGPSDIIRIFRNRFSVPSKPVNPKLAQRPGFLTQARAFFSSNPAQIINGTPTTPQRPVLRASK